MTTTAPEASFSPEFLADSKYWWTRKTPEDLATPAEPSIAELVSIANNKRNITLMIRTTFPSMDGWCTVLKGHALAALTLAIKPQIALEIGTFAGRSFLPILWALKDNGYGKAIGIDPYDAQVSSEQEYPGSSEWWSSVDHSIIERKFHGFLKNFGLTDWAKIIKRKSDDVEPPPSIDLLHIDGGHTEVALRDAQRFGKNVRVGGVVVLDDIQWVGGAVLRAIDELEQLGFVERYRNTDENWNLMQRVR